MLFTFIEIGGIGVRREREGGGVLLQQRSKQKI